MKRTKWFLTLLLMALLCAVLVFAVSAEGDVTIVDSGYCGNKGDDTNLTWTLDSGGTLTINGSGKMKHYTNASIQPNNSPVPWDAYKTDIRAIVMEPGVTTIGTSAFADCENLLSVTIPNGVTEIGDYAFSRCTALTSVTIPNGVTEIGNVAFSECTSLTTVTIPSSVQTIGDVAFYWCKSLTSFTVDAANENYCNDEDGVLFSKDMTVLLQYPARKEQATYAIPSGVTEIGDYAFSECTSLTTVTMPSSLTSIGEGAFIMCTSLMDVTIGEHVTRIGQEAFALCTGLPSITIPASVDEIGIGPFVLCSLLEEIAVDAANENYCNDEDGVLFSKDMTVLLQYPAGKEPTTYAIPSGVTEIGGGAFYECTGLTAVTIPSSLTSIGDSAFENCEALADIYYLGAAAQWEQVAVQDGNEALLNATVHCSLIAFGQCGDNLTWTLDNGGTLTISGSGKMKDYTNASFQPNDSPVPWNAYKTDIRAIVMKPGVTTIGVVAFADCENLLSVTIPDGVTEIGDFAFSKCTSLTTVTIPSSVQTIGHDAFRWCKSLTSFTVDAANENYCNDEDGVLFSKDMTVLLQYPAGKEQAAYAIPSGVTSIGISAFEECWHLTSVEIPNTVTEIGNGAFFDCVSLIALTVPDSVQTIGKGAFAGCSDLASVTIGSGVKTIGDGAFQHCLSLTSVTIPDNVLSVGSGAFEVCSGLTSVRIGTGVEKIGTAAFDLCFSLEEIAVDAGNPAFASDENGCLYDKDKTELIQYPIGNTDPEFMISSGVTTVGRSTFSGCLNLKTVTLPETVTKIGEFALYDCACLETVTVQGMDTIIGAYALGQSDIKLKGEPDETVAALFAMLNDLPQSGKMFWVVEGHTPYPEQYVETGDFRIGTIVCHAGSTAEAYAIEHSIDYKLTHFFEGDWSYDWDNLVRWRKCIHCDERETEPLEKETSGDTEIIAPSGDAGEFDSEKQNEKSSKYVLVQSAMRAHHPNPWSIVTIYDITFLDHDGNAQQPSGWVQVRLPLHWMHDHYKVYRVNDDGTLTDMQAQRMGDFIVFNTDHFSLYVIVDESTEATPDEPTPDTPKESKSFFDRLAEFIKTIVEMIQRTVHFFQSIGK